MTTQVSGDALTALVADMQEIRSACGFMWMRMAVATDAQDAYDVAKREFEDHQAAFKRLETSLPELAALIAAGRSAATTEPRWKGERVRAFAEALGFDPDTGEQSAPAPLPAPRCVWKEEPNGEYWESACGETWTFIDGNPSENKARFCHGCGKPIQAIGVMEQIDAEEEPAPAPAPLPAPTAEEG